jgi:DNA-directed RNA polymerase subunit L
VPELFIRVQTDGTITPKEALVQVCKDLISEFQTFSQRFTREFELRRMVDAGDQGNQQSGI